MFKSVINASWCSTAFNLRTIIFFIYTNDSNNLKSVIKLFTDGTSLFPTFFDSSLSANQPDLFKQAQEVVFSRKTNMISHRTTTFKSVPVTRTRHLYLEEKLNFSQHVNIKIVKANKGIGTI